MASSTHPNHKLSDTHLVLLSAAAQRDDGLLVPPDTLKGAALAAALKALLKRGLIEDVAVACDQSDSPLGEVGRSGQARITRAGLDALGVTPEGDENAALTKSAEASGAPKPSRGRKGAADETTPQPVQAKLASAAAARPGTKRALVIGLLGQESGATLDDLMAATGWLAHTTRAALTGLRQSGYTLERSKGADGRTTYRVTGGPDVASVEQAAS